MKPYNSTLISLILLCIMNTMSGDNILDSLKENIGDTKDLLTDTASKICIMDEGCNTAFLNINNYCCTLQCCNMFEYIVNNEKYWDNLMHTFSSPRAINIIILVAIIVAIASIIGVFVKLVCCLCCGCCGSKKYVIVGNN